MFRARDTTRQQRRTHAIFYTFGTTWALYRCFICQRKQYVRVLFPQSHLIAPPPVSTRREITFEDHLTLPSLSSHWCPIPEKSASLFSLKRDSIDKNPLCIPSAIHAGTKHPHLRYPDTRYAVCHPVFCPVSQCGHIRLTGRYPCNITKPSPNANSAIGHRFLNAHRCSLSS